MFDYYTGTGHRVLKKCYEVKTLQGYLKDKHSNISRRRILAEIETFKIPVKPDIAGVLYSLLLDSSAANESLNEWCDNFGYDPDSIKALNIYKACLENAAKLNIIFSRTELQSFSELLGDY